MLSCRLIAKWVAISPHNQLWLDKNIWNFFASLYALVCSQLLTIEDSIGLISKETYRCSEVLQCFTFYYIIWFLLAQYHVELYHVEIAITAVVSHLFFLINCFNFNWHIIRLYYIKMNLALRLFRTSSTTVICCTINLIKNERRSRDYINLFDYFLWE